MPLVVDIKKQFSSFSLDINFSIGNGLSVLFGHSGSGKSLTLKVIAGLIAADAGSICLNKKILFCSSRGINLSTQKRNVGYLSQNHSLFPHFTVLENIVYCTKRLEKKLIAPITKEVIEKFQLTDITDKYPNQISGGQKQKVAVAATVINQPHILLLDEPFSALDIATKASLRENLKIIQKNLNIPTILVTHDIYEACLLADTILTISKGQIVQKEDFPQEIKSFWLQ